MLPYALKYFYYASRYRIDKNGTGTYILLLSHDLFLRIQILNDPDPQGSAKLEGIEENKLRFRFKTIASKKYYFILGTVAVP